MSDNRSNRHPEFLQETMFQEHGTRVLITNPAADQYLDQYAAQKKKEEESVPDINIEEEEQFLSELEEKIKADTEDEQWWAEWQEKMKKIEAMEKELGVERDDVITKEEYDWVDKELEEIERLISKGELL